MSDIYFSPRDKARRLLDDASEHVRLLSLGARLSAPGEPSPAMRLAAASIAARAGACWIDRVGDGTSELLAGVWSRALGADKLIRIREGGAPTGGPKLSRRLDFSSGSLLEIAIGAMDRSADPEELRRVISMGSCAMMAASHRANARATSPSFEDVLKHLRAESILQCAHDASLPLHIRQSTALSLRNFGHAEQDLATLRAPFEAILDMFGPQLSDGEGATPWRDLANPKGMAIVVECGANDARRPQTRLASAFCASIAKNFATAWGPGAARATGNIPTVCLAGGRPPRGWGMTPCSSPGFVSRLAFEADSPDDCGADPSDFAHAAGAATLWAFDGAALAHPELGPLSLCAADTFNEPRLAALREEERSRAQMRALAESVRTPGREESKGAARL